MNRISLLLFVLFGAVPAFLRAQAQPLTVYDLLARVEAEHPDLGRLQAALDANRGQRLVEYGLEAPTLLYAREGIAGTDFAEQRLGVSQSLSSPVATYYGRRRLDAEATALRLDAEARRAILRLDITQAFVDAMYAERLVALRTSALALAEQFVEAAQLREAVGEAAGLETMRAELAWAEAEAALSDARQSLAESHIAIRAAAALGEEVSVVTPGPLAFRAVTLSRPDLLRRLPALPEWRGAEARADAAALAVREARGASFPGLTLEVFPQDFGAGFDHFGFEVGLRVPLPGSAATRGPRAVAAAAVRARAWEQTATAVTLGAEAEAAWTGFEAARAAIVRYHDVIGPQTDTLVARSHEGYLLGEVPLFALLDAQHAALTAEERYAAALRTYFRRLAELERFIGRPLVFPASP